MYTNIKHIQYAIMLQDISNVFTLTADASREKLRPLLLAGKPVVCLLLLARQEVIVTCVICLCCCGGRGLAVGCREAAIQASSAASCLDGGLELHNRHDAALVCLGIVVVCCSAT